MSGMNFNTSNDTFKKLMGNGTSYIVPKFQRDYSWSEEEWDDLWQDILELFKSKKNDFHYMGYLVLQSKDSENFDVIDGQQRITTLSILILAALKNLQILQSKNIDSDNNKKREKALSNTYIGYLNPATLISKSKLQLNKQNNRFYQDYLAPLQQFPKRGLNPSEKLMKKGFEWFAEKIQKDISDNSGKKLGGASFPDFLRIYWNSSNQFVRKTNLFKTIKKNIQNKKEAFSLIRDLARDADFYAALRSPEDDLWTEPEQKESVKLLLMFGIKQPHSLLMIAFNKMDANNFTKLLRACRIISFRYNVICGLHGGEQERLYNKTALKIAQNKLNNVSDVIKILKKDLYPEDKIFKAAFTNKELIVKGPRNKKIVRYILFELEKNISNNAYDFESPKYSIEHILPQSPGENWQDYNENNDYRFINRLGNYTLLTKKENSELGDKSYSDKKRVYAESKFQITKEISENNDTWEPGRIVQSVKPSYQNEHNQYGA